MDLLILGRKMTEKDTLIFTLVSLIIFIVGIFIGILNHRNILEIARLIYNLGVQGNKEITIYNKIYLFAFIFVRNTMATTLNISLGPIFGLFPLFSLLFNGYLIGGITTEVAKSFGLIYALKGVLPHGIFEIPAYIYSSVLGFRVAYAAIKNSFEGHKFTEIYRRSLREELKIIIPLLLIAAFIEAFITSSLLGY